MGILLLLSVQIIMYIIMYNHVDIFEKNLKIKIATSGNRTRASRVAGENSTTEPTLLERMKVLFGYVVKIGT